MIDLQIVGVLVVALYDKGDGVGPQVIIVVGCRLAFAPEPRQDYATHRHILLDGCSHC